jgi:hypothetical protein
LSENAGSRLLLVTLVSAVFSSFFVFGMRCNGNADISPVLLKVATHKISVLQEKHQKYTFKKLPSLFKINYFNCQKDYGNVLRAQVVRLR